VPTTTPTVRSVRISAGRHLLVGVTHDGCGGEIHACRCDRDEDHKDDDGDVIPMSWECVCQSCWACDPNGHSSLRECKIEAPGYWGPEAEDER
jgi:hypothetical protein